MMKRNLLAVIACFAVAALVPSVGYSQQDGGPPREGGDRGFGGPPPRDGGGPGRGGPDMMRMIPVMAALDKDGDGVISSDEIAGAVAALKTLDKNQDGKLDGEELRPAFGGPGGPGGRGPGGFGGPGGGREGGSSDPAAMVTRLMSLDKNSDGQLSKEEMGERLATLFDRTDADKNGVVTKAEIEAMASQGGGRGPGGPSGRGEDGGDRPRRPAAE